jgi:UDP-GlcNAc:undecaprenyl-phosphate GlcNAc-1-phosphate transferase
LFSTSLPFVIACQLAAFLVAGVYRGVWRYITITDLFAYVRGVAFGGVLMVLTLVYLYRFKGYSRSVFMINAMLVGLLVVGSRLSFRWLSDRAARQRPAVQRAIVRRGRRRSAPVRELNNNPKYEAFRSASDDDATKRHRRIDACYAPGRKRRPSSPGIGRIGSGEHREDLAGVNARARARVRVPARRS